MAILSGITFYPVKSCAGVAVREAVLTPSGLMVDAIRDREWMLVDAAGQFLTQREHPRMALITPRLDGAALQLRAPGLAPLALSPTPPDPATAPTLQVQVWDDRVLAYDCGDTAADWCARALGVPCRLVRSHPAAGRTASAKWTAGVAAPTLFSDGYPVLVIGQASLDDLNEKLVAAGRDALPMNRFRPNLVLDGLDAFEEDYAESFRLGDMCLKPVKPCPRCPVPSVDQATGLVGPDPLDLLRQYRRKPALDDAVCFGMNSIVVEGETQRLHVGQEIAVTLAF